MTNELEEFEDQGKKWPTEVTWRPKNITGRFNQENWRSDTYEFINSLAMSEDINLAFDLEYCDLLHDQLMRAQIAPVARVRDIGQGTAKGWIIKDPWREDHVLDSFTLAMFAILTGQVIIPEAKPLPKSPWEDAKASFDYRRAKEEQREMTGFLRKHEYVKDEDMFEKHFGRRRDSNSMFAGMGGWYPDES